MQFGQRLRGIAQVEIFLLFACSNCADRGEDRPPPLSDAGRPLGLVHLNLW